MTDDSARQAGALLPREPVGFGRPVGDAGGHVAASFEQRLKACVHTPEFFDHGPEKGHQRFASVGWGALAKRYLSGDVYLRLGIVWGDGAVREKVGKYHAFIEVAGATDDESDVTATYREIADPGHFATRADSDQFHVLVDVRHAKDGPQRLVRSIVRPEPDDLFEQIAVEIDDFVGPAFSLKVAEAITAREVNFAGIDLLPGEPGESDCGLVERRSELVNQLPCKDVHDFWRGRIQADFRQFVSGLRFRIENNPARVSLKEFPLGAFKLDEVVICSR